MHGCVTHKEPQNICACCVLSIFKNNDTRHAPLSYNIHQQQRPTPASAHESAHWYHAPVSSSLFIFSWLVAFSRKTEIHRGWSQ